jgi:uncharacterized protein
VAGLPKPATITAEARCVSIEFVAALGAAFFGGILSGLAGFGFALVVVPPLLLLYDPPTVTAVAISLTLVTGWVVLVGTWRRVQVETVIGLLPGALVGLGIGVVLIRTLDGDAIKLMASLVVLLYSLSLIRRWQFAAVESRWAPPIAGLFSGALNTSTGMAGPPVALLMASRSFGIHEFRASIIAYFYVVDALGMGLLVQQGIVGRPEMRVVVALLPAAVLGTLIGRQAIGRFSLAGFRSLTLSLLLVTGFVGMVSAVWGLAR